MHNARRKFFIFCWLSLFINLFGYFLISPNILMSLFILGPVMLVGFYDILQKRRTILRNFPILGHLRYLFESIRPEIQQYFVETETGGKPFSRDIRSIVYQRAKKQLDTRPFGTQLDIFNTGYEWMNHSINPIKVTDKDLRVSVGGTDCTAPYSASIFNVSAMSYGSLSGRAVRALNGGAKLGNFAHNTGEGGISNHHRMGGDLIWQIGTGYFGCRDDNGFFSQKYFQKYATEPQVKMIEIKLSQGAKPGHGGILPAIKNTAEIARIRHLKPGVAIHSPGYHTAFNNPLEMCHFIKLLRKLSGGKPVGIKLCIGKKRQFLGLCKAMITTGVAPDFITVDGGEGGTGAAPLEFQNRLGYPAKEGLIFVNNALVGFGLRKKIKIITSGRIITAFDIISKIAVGADLCNSARGMMFALGCIQAVQCNANTCPTGVTTHNPQLTVGLVVPLKELRVKNYHNNTIAGVVEMLAAMGLQSTEELHPRHLMRRSSPFKVNDYSELFEYLDEEVLLKKPYPENWKKYMDYASEKVF